MFHCCSPLHISGGLSGGPQDAFTCSGRTLTFPTLRETRPVVTRVEKVLESVIGGPTALFPSGELLPELGRLSQLTFDPHFLQASLLPLLSSYMFVQTLLSSRRGRSLLHELSGVARGWFAFAEPSFSR